MQIVVVSDTHGETSFVSKLTSLYPNAKYFLHAGDSCVQEMMIFPFQTVKGNCDYYINNRLKIMNILGVGIYMFHGDHFILDDDLLIGLAKENKAKIIIYGHTHIPYYKCIDDIHILCPGSIAYPRVTKATYALISFNTIEDIKIEIKNYI